MTAVSGVNNVNLNGAPQLASSSNAIVAPKYNLAAKFLSTPTGLGSDTVTFSAKAAVAKQQAPATPSPVAAAFAGVLAGVRATTNAAATPSPSKSMAQMFFGDSASSSDLGVDQKVAGGGASSSGGGSSHA